MGPGQGGEGRLKQLKLLHTDPYCPKRHGTLDHNSSCLLRREQLLHEDGGQSLGQLAPLGSSQGMHPKSTRPRMITDAKVTRN